MELIDILNETYPTAPVTSLKRDLQVDWSKMSPATLAHLAWHGLKQKINDPNGAKDLTNEDKLANSQKVLSNLENNIIRDTARSADPIEAEYNRLAMAAVANALVAKGHKLADLKTSDLRARAAKIATTLPDLHATLMAQAESAVKAKAATASALADII